MSVNDRYEVIGGILYHTPVDETHESIQSDNFVKAKSIGDQLLDAKTLDAIAAIIASINDEMVNYLNSPLIDELKKGPQIYWLFNAASNGNLTTIKYLLLHGLNVNEYGGSALCAACFKGHFDIVKHLVEEASINFHRLDEQPLRDAAGEGHLNIVKYLVEAGADINIENGRALYFAIVHGHLDVVKYLVEAGTAILPYHFSSPSSTFTENDANIIKYLAMTGWK